MISVRDVRAVARLDLAEVLRSRWLVFCALVYGVLGVLFVLVAFRESAILGFTGMGRVLMSLCHALLLILPLLGLTATSQVINGARESGALELLFSHPFSRAGYFVAVSLVRYLAVLAPLLVLVAGLALYGFVALGEAVPWAFVVRGTALAAALLWAFVGGGLMISVWVRNQAKALTTMLLAWAAGVALLDFALVGAMLQWRLNPEGVFLLAALNPVQAARMALLATAEPELAVLGPVGFYLANRVGPNALLALGIGWPAAVGVLTWTAGFARFRRGDLL